MNVFNEMVIVYNVMFSDMMFIGVDEKMKIILNLLEDNYFLLQNVEIYERSKEIVKKMVKDFCLFYRFLVEKY